MLNNFKTDEEIVQINEKKSKTNIEFKESKNNKKENEDSKTKNNKKEYNETVVNDSSLLTSFWFWLVMFMALVSIAVIYKKH
jgi:hypothetical protein